MKPKAIRSILALVLLVGLLLAVAPSALAATIVVTPAATPTDTDNDFTRIQTALAAATTGDTIDLQGTFNWTEPYALADYTASSSTSNDGDIRGVEIPSGVNNLTITSSTANAHIIGAGDDIVDSSLIFSVFIFADDTKPSTLGNTNLTIEKLNIDDFEGAITLGWNATGTFNGTMIRNNTIVVSGDNGNATDWIQNIAIYFWIGQNQTMQDNLITFQADGTRTVGYSGPKKGASFGFQNGTSGGTGYNGLQIKNNTFQVGATSTGVGGEETYGIWENSHNDDNGSVITLSGNSFLGRAGDDFDHAFLLSSQTTGLTIIGNTLNGVDDVFLATKSQGHAVGDRYTFSGNTLTSVGGADGIFLQNVTNDAPPTVVTVNWDISNSVDGETGIRGLNELSTQATHASRPASAATDIAAVTGQGPQTTTAVDDNWGTPGRFTDPDGIGTGAGPVAYGFNTYTMVQDGINAVTNSTVYVAAGLYVGDVNIPASVTLKGAQYGVAVSGRTAASASESTLQGLVTVGASNVVLDGFTLTNPGQTYALSVGNHTPSYSAIAITHNIIDTVGAVGLAQNVHSIVLTNGPDSVTIAHNRFNNIKAGAKSVSAVGVLDSASTDPSNGLVIQDNTFSDIASASKGAYGVILNNGAGETAYRTSPAAVCRTRRSRTIPSPG